MLGAEVPMSDSLAPATTTPPLEPRAARPATAAELRAQADAIEAEEAEEAAWHAVRARARMIELETPAERTAREAKEEIEARRLRKVPSGGGFYK
jgi:hypothetical protein